MASLRILVLGTLLLASPCFSDITKTAVPTDEGLKFYWWPNVEIPNGWFHDRDISLVRSANFLIPIGETFSDAEVILYARAIYKESPGVSPTLDALILSDIEMFESLPSTVNVRKVNALPIADGSLTISYTFLPESEGNWEQVSYIDDGDFFTMFVVSSRTQSGYLSALVAYEEMIGSYVGEP